MGKPRMIILVRHAQSEGNKNREIHQTTPDHRVKLTPDGHRQAQDAGSRLRELLHPDDTLHFFTSPYRRTRETTEGILDSLTSDEPCPSPFPRHTVKVYEEPRLREQDFGNFQPCSAEMERMWMERSDYGHFFYRIPNGESAADAYDRVSGFNESLWRLFGEDDFASVCVLVTHGLMARVFLMKWYHWSVEYFEDLRNINHCEFVMMTLNPENGKYTLQNQLRTWSELRKERDRERAAMALTPAPTSPSDHTPIRRKWGGCPDGCNHGISSGVKQSLRANLTGNMRQGSGSSRSKLADGITDSIGDPKNTEPGSSAAPAASTSSLPSKPDVVLSTPDNNTSQAPLEADQASNSHNHLQSNTNAQQKVACKDAEDANKHRNFRDSSDDTRPLPFASHPKRPTLHGFHRDSEDHLLHPPASSSSSCLRYTLLHLGGRDGGGSMSGANSLAPSDDENEDPASAATAEAKTPGLQARTGPPPRSTAVPTTSPDRPTESQEIEDDGDDEMSGNLSDTQRKSRGHHHQYNRHHHPLSTDSTAEEKRHHRLMIDILGDGDTSTTPPEDTEHTSGGENTERTPDEASGLSYTQTQPNTEDEEPSLEKQQQEEQSIRGSVY